MTTVAFKAECVVTEHPSGSFMIDGVDDGKVSVESTKAEGMRPYGNPAAELER